MTDQGREKVSGTEGERICPPADVVELQLLLPTRLALDLESAAQGRGLSMGQMVRRLVRDFLVEADQRGGAPP